MMTLLLFFSYGCEENTDSNDNHTVEDYDGNVYETIQIGEQIWMAENLKTTRYADGTEIQVVEDNSIWDALEYSDKAMCYYDNSSTSKDTYGALYTWAAAMNGAQTSSENPSQVQGVCPDGWHIPSDAEWKQLEMHLGMSHDDAGMPAWRGTNEGSKMAGNAELWFDEALENDASFGLSGFKALPAGYRYRDGFFSHEGIGTDFWSSTESGDTLVWTRFLFCYNTDIYRFTNGKNQGFSVRCVKD